MLLQPVETLSVRPLTGLNRDLDYRVPATLQTQLEVGSLVRIPVRNRQEMGIVTRLEASGDFPVSRLKYLASVEQPFPVLTPELITMAEWMARYYAADLAAVFELMIPAPVRKGMQPRRRSFFRAAPDSEGDSVEELRRRAPRQAELLAFLRSQPGRRAVPKATVLKRMGIAAASCRALVEKGLIVEETVDHPREAYSDELAGAEHVTAMDLTLNAEQQEAADAIVKRVEAGGYDAYLLHGVTGSGKTEVYLAALQQALAVGGGAIFLVPEVALTPQTIGRMRARLEQQSGVRAVVWHSHLSEGERYDAWHALATGEARVVVGARSAIFAPIRNLRLIVVDEEHEPAYKQEETPRYHGRDVAVYRATLCRCTCVLGSATPSMESLYNVERDKYRLLRLRCRVDDRALPLMHVVDMKREVLSQKGHVVFSRLLLDKIGERLERREQSILFLNRRGYNTSMLCPDCGHVAVCDHCSITLTFHRADNILRCHLCGFDQVAPQRCPKCRSPKIRWRGSGTQRIEDVAQRIFPKARIVRIDADAMQKKNLFRSILADFRKGLIDILVGTQMIAKGLDFPNVTLVGLVDADLSLHLPDFRALERTFQLLVQVAGRAGRGDRAGEVVVQTFMPHAAPIQHARKQDFEGFIDGEMEQRREYRYPPFRHLIHHIFRGKNPEKVQFFAEQWARLLEKEIPKSVEIRGPAPAPIEKIKDHYRFQLWYFTPSITPFIDQLADLRRSFPKEKDLHDVIDVDPVNLI